MRRSHILLNVLLFASCNRPALVPKVGSGPLATTDLIRHSEAIFVGSISSFKFGERIHAHVPLFPELNDCLVPVRVTVSIENVLRGSLRPGALDYYYFASVCAIMGPVENPTSNQRSIFFLRREHGRWRTIEDYWKNRLWIFSGRHSDDLIRGRTVYEAIPLILLTPGEGFSAERFASEGFSWGAGPARELVGEAGARRLLTPILKHPDLYVRFQACITLEPHDGPWDCAGPVLAAVLDRVVSGDSAWITPRIFFDLQMLAGHADRTIQQRTKRLFPMMKIHTGPPGSLPPPTATPLR
jgi:hypothetical protein